jgi:hypothetical protein
MCFFLWSLRIKSRTKQLRISNIKAIILVSKFSVKQRNVFLKSLSGFSIRLSLPRVCAEDEKV